MLRKGILLLIAALLTGGADIGWAQVAGVELQLTGGEVVGAVRGEGTASVTVEVRNTSDRVLTGIALRVYYSTVNLFPSDYDSADWRPHEFLLDPPLAPGQKRKIAFRDDYAAEFILLEVTKAAFGDVVGVSDDGLPPPDASLPPADSQQVLYQGLPVQLEKGLKERSGVAYIASRDLMDLVGGGLSYDEKTYQIVLERAGHVVKVREDRTQAEADGKKVELKHKVLSINGSSFLPLIDIAPLLGLHASHDKTTGYYVIDQEL